MQAKNILLRPKPYLGNGNTIIFGSVVGSYAYGTNIEDSDVDVKWIYIQSYEDFFLNGYKPFITISKDETIYELTRFIELLQKANVMALELLYSPTEMIIYKHACFNPLLAMKRDFLTQQCKHSFGGLAMSQIDKAKRIDEKWQMEKERVDRKSILDFCYWVTAGIEYRLGNDFQSIPIMDKYKDFQIKRMGIAPIPNIPNLYNLYWDFVYDFGGFVTDKMTSTDVKTVQVPPNSNNIGLLHFDKTAYKDHCQKFHEYQTWLAQRTVSRLKVDGDGSAVDGKDMLHCMRLIETASDIAEFKELLVRRDNADYLKDIRAGVYDLKDIIGNARRKIDMLDRAYENSDLVEKFKNIGKLRTIQNNMRTTVHNLTSQSSVNSY